MTFIPAIKIGDIVVLHSNVENHEFVESFVDRDLTEGQRALLIHIGIMAAFTAPNYERAAAAGIPNDWERLKKEGQFWTPPIDSKLPKGMRRGKPQMCFMNAAILAWKYPTELRYCEGYANSLIPVHHAWNVTEDGKVIDNTWKHDDDYTDAAYFGIAVDIETLNKHLLKTQVYGLLFNTW